MTIKGVHICNIAPSSVPKFKSQKVYFGKKEDRYREKLPGHRKKTEDDALSIFQSSSTAFFIGKRNRSCTQPSTLISVFLADYSTVINEFSNKRHSIHRQICYGLILF